MAQNCAACGRPLGDWRYYLHGEKFCSYECMNKVYGERLVRV